MSGLEATTTSLIGADTDTVSRDISSLFSCLSEHETKNIVNIAIVISNVGFICLLIGVSSLFKFVEAASINRFSCVFLVLIKLTSLMLIKLVDLFRI